MLDEAVSKGTGFVGTQVCRESLRGIAAPALTLASDDERDAAAAIAVALADEGEGSVMDDNLAEAGEVDVVRRNEGLGIAL